MMTQETIQSQPSRDNKSTWKPESIYNIYRQPENLKAYITSIDWIYIYIYTYAYIYIYI